MNKQQFTHDFMAWYQQHKRDLPWRKSQSPYHIWLSEIMLQQTQVQTVIPYFERFIEAFPDLQALAAADEESLTQHWAGLGYYSRVRNIQKAAQVLVNEYDSKWPTTVSELVKLPGIGPYTAGAIASMAFGEAVPAVDGNAFRVFSRVFADQEDVAKPKARSHFEKLITPLLPLQKPGDFNQAVMDLGATICLPKAPSCQECPIQAYCIANQTGTQLDFPVKTKKKKPKAVHLYAVISHQQQDFLVIKRPSTGLLANMITFPLYEDSLFIPEEGLEKTLAPEEKLVFLKQYMQDSQGITVDKLTLQTGKTVVHHFTHLTWTIDLVTAEIPAETDLSYFEGQWLAASELKKVTASTLQKKLMTAVVSK